VLDGETWELVSVPGPLTLVNGLNLSHQV
jgi:hypothetical protein